jgi:hypothetical protein
MFNDQIHCGLSCWSKIPGGLPTISKILPATSIKTSWPTCTMTSSKVRQMSAYSVGLAISGKINCANKKKKKNVMLPDAVFLVMCDPSMNEL